MPCAETRSNSNQKPTGEALAAAASVCKITGVVLAMRVCLHSLLSTPSPPSSSSSSGRQTYVFNAAGKCVLSFNDQLNAEKHVDEALAALKA